MVSLAYLLMFSIIANNLWGGTLRYRCVDQYGDFSSGLGTNPCYTDEPSGRGQRQKQECVAFDPSVVMLCEDFASEDDDGLEYTCRDNWAGGAKFENPAYGLISFDNVAISMLNLFQVVTYEGWDQIMVYAQSVSGMATIFVFIVLLITGAR